MRTQEEILARMEAVKDDDFMGWQRGDLIDYLDYQHAKPYLKEGVTEEQWQKVRDDMPPPVERIRDYMDFAWGKALDERGISASRSIDHMKSWLWLAGEDELLAVADNGYTYEPYGIPILRRISAHYNLDDPTKETIE